MKHAINWKNKIVEIEEISEPELLEVAVKVGGGEWELVSEQMIFEDKDAAKKYLFMRKLKKGNMR